MEKREGKPVNRANLAGLYVLQKFEYRQFLELKRLQFSRHSDEFANFEVRRACVVAAWLVPVLRPIVESSVPSRETPMYANAETLEFFGSAGLDDEAWDALMAQYNEQICSSE